MDHKQLAEDDDKVVFVAGSGNVFADLGLENADEPLVKADLANALNGVIRSHGWTQAEAAARAGLTQPDISRIGQMKTDSFSQERLQNALRHLGMDVEIRLHLRKNGGIGTLKVRELA
jgi:predicted XRE-type DNA-binding protein